MGSINTGRVVLGGLLAAVIIFFSTAFRVAMLLEQIRELVEVHGLRGPTGLEGFIVFAGMSISFGLLMVWLYAAIRPRFGAGPMTAVIGGLFFWLAVYLVPYAVFLRIDLVPLGLVVIHWMWTVIEIPLASVAGAWVYQEE